MWRSKRTCQHALLCGVQHTWQREDGQCDERGLPSQGSRRCQPVPARPLPLPKRGAAPALVATLAAIQAACYTCRGTCRSADRR